MGAFSPHCPICGNNDQVEIYFDGRSYYIDRYYCRRCRRIFYARNGYTPVTESFYQVGEGSVSWSGSATFISSSE